MIESGYAYNSANHALTHYSQQPPDYESSTYQTKELLLEGLSDWRFSYWDGQAWEAHWAENGQLPRAIKINFRFLDRQTEEEYVVNIPVSQ